MRVYKKSGTKERLLEMFENVNKIKLNESFGEKMVYNCNIIDNGESSKNYPVLASSKEEARDILSKKFNIPYDDPNLGVKVGEPVSKDTHITHTSDEIIENFDSPVAKDKEYLDKTVGTEDSQVSKYDDGTRYPVEDKLKVKDPSLEKLKGDDAPIEEGNGNFVTGAEVGETFQEFNEDDDQDIADEDEPVNVGDTEPEPNDGEGESGFGDIPADDADVDSGAEIDALPADDAQADEPELSDEIGDGSFEDQLNGGLADDASPSDFDPQQISKGIAIEMEHTDDPHKALEIAMDHLTEIPDYYDRLESMEAEAKGENGEEPCCGDEDSPEDSLLDPSTHWIDDYSAKNVADEDINYDSPLANNTSAGEAGEEDAIEMDKLKSGELEAEKDLDAEDWNQRIKSGQMKPIN